MTERKKILAISGSTRQRSTNLNLINAIIGLFSYEADIKLFQGLSDLPHFNPDIDTETSPKSVLDFRTQLSNADGVLICTPEYAMGVPGTLKNAIDWTVSSMEFSNKPVALITASSSGHKAHISLLETLRVIQANIPQDSQLVISFAQTKVTGNKIIDAVTVEQVKKLMSSLINTMIEKL